MMPNPTTHSSQGGTTMNPTTTPIQPVPRSHGLKKVFAATLLTGVAALTFGATAVQAQGATDAGVVDTRIERACARIPNLQTRLDNAVERITGEADVRGSLRWLDTKIQAATDAGRTDLATALTNRRVVREATLEVIELRRANLDEFAALCDGRS